MTRRLHPMLVGLLLWLLVPLAAVAQPESSPPSTTGPRDLAHPTFSYENFASWLFAVRPEVQHRPVSLVLLWNMTDSVRGAIVDDVDYRGLLTDTWLNELLQPVLTGFLVPWIQHADGAEVQGDRLTMLEFRAQRVNPIEVEGWTDRWGGSPSQQIAFLRSFPGPGVTTDPDEFGTDLNKHMNDALAQVGDRYGSDNLLVLMITDEHRQFDPDPRPPAQAEAFETFLAVRGDGVSRTMTIYAYWNDFPDEREFLFYDEERATSEVQTRWDRIEQIRIGVPPERFGDTEVPPLIEQKTLTVTFAGDGSGRVWSSPDGIDSAAGRTDAGFNRGAVVSLTVEPSGFGAFGGFGFAPGAGYGCGSGSTETTCVLTMDAARSVTLTFIAPPPFNWVPLLVGALVLALIAFVLRTWLLERYEVRDERGLLDRGTGVFPGRSKRIAVPNPADPNEAIGHLTVVRPLPFGLSRLRFVPVKGYTVTLEGRRRGRQATVGPARSKRGKRARAGFVLVAGQRKPERHVLRYLKGEAANHADTGEAAPSPDAADAPPSVNAGAVTLHVQHLVGAAKRKRKGKVMSSDASGQGGRRAGRKGRRRVELSDMEEGAPG